MADSVGKPSLSPTTTSPTTTTSTGNITSVSSSSLSSDPLACQWASCGERCTSPETLYDHVCERHVGRKSTNNLNLQCQWGNCRTTTVKRDHITSHIRVHVPLKPHKCEFCGKSFKRPQDLKKHVKTHADESVLLRSPEPPLPSHKSNTSSAYQPSAMRTSGYYQDTNSHVQAGSYGYPTTTANHNHFSAPITNPSYGPVYYNVPQTTGYATSAAPEARKRGFDELNDFFGNAKRRQIDATQYQDLGSRFAGIMGASMPVSGFQAGYNAGLMAAAGGVMLDDHMGATAAYQGPQSVGTLPSNHYTASFPELKSKNDLMTLDQFLEQLQTTVYEHPDNAATVAVPVSQLQSTGYPTNYRNTYSPSRNVHNSSVSSVGTATDVFSNTSYGNGGSIASSATFDDSTPALTPSSYAAASQSPASSQVNISPMARPAGTNASLYPTLPSFSTLTDLGVQQAGGIAGAPPMSGLGSAYDEFDNRRRYSGGFLQRAQPTRLSPLSQLNSHESTGSDSTTSPSSRRSSIDLSKPFRNVNLSSPKQYNVKLPGVASITRVNTRDSMGSASSAGSDGQGSADDEKQESWVRNMRVIEELLRYVRGRLDRGEYEDDAEGNGIKSRREKERGRDEDLDMRDQCEQADSARVAQTGSGASLYPVLRAVEAGS